LALKFERSGNKSQKKDFLKTSVRFNTKFFVDFKTVGKIAKNFHKKERNLNFSICTLDYKFLWVITLLRQTFFSTFSTALKS
jgi:hypothetical protein